MVLPKLLNSKCSKERSTKIFFLLNGSDKKMTDELFFKVAPEIKTVEQRKGVSHSYRKGH